VEAILGSRYFGPAKAEGGIDEREGNNFVAFACTSQETAAHGHAVHGVQELSKTASKGALEWQHWSREMSVVW